MKLLLALVVVGLVDVAFSCDPCKTMKWALCSDSCVCSLPLGAGTPPLQLDCTKLVPKCFLMKAEMYRRSRGESVRAGGKPVETALVDNDGIYNPECNAQGRFMAKQCNNTDVCWCVNSAGVRRSDKGDQNINCEDVETYWVRLELKHNTTSAALDTAKLRTGIENAFLERFQLAKTYVSDVQYDKDGRLIIVDVQKQKGQGDATDLSLMTYYIEKDIKATPLFADGKPFEVKVEGTPVSMEKILVYYVDEKAPTITMQKLTGGVIAVIVVVSLIVIGGVLVLYLIARRQRAQYAKAQPREMETMSS